MSVESCCGVLTQFLLLLLTIGAEVECHKGKASNMELA